MSCEAGLMVLKWPLRWTLMTGALTTTLAPSCARRGATARPMPRPAPVTTAERLVRRLGMGDLQWGKEKRAMGNGGRRATARCFESLSTNGRAAGAGDY